MTLPGEAARICEALFAHRRRQARRVREFEDAAREPGVIEGLVKQRAVAADFGEAR